MKSNLHLAWALKYASKGWRVFPIKPRQKQPPLISDNLVRASSDPEQITRWWTEWPDANIGVVTGESFFVFDTDPRNGGDQTRAHMVQTHGAFPDTLAQITGGNGRQEFFSMPEQAVIKSGPLYGSPGIDIKADGGYVLLPPSVHPSGKRYDWDGLDAEDAPIQAAAAWLIEAVCAHPNGHEHLPEDLKNVQEGRGHYSCKSLAIGMADMGAPENVIAAAVATHDQQNCPQPARSLQKAEKSAQELAHWAVTHRTPDPRWLSKGPQGEEALPAPTEREHSIMAYDANVPEPKPILDPVLYPGLTLLGGRPKVGKSWLALQLGIAVVNQLKLGGYLTVQKKCRCLYVSLEDRRPQLKKRLHHLVPDASYLEGLDLIYHLEPLMAGGAAQLDQTLTADPVDVLIVDSLLAAVRQAGRKNQDIMQSDYNIIGTLRELATKHGIAVVVVAHTRKMGGDFLDLIQGTTGTTAAADAIWVLQRTPEGKATLSVTGREVPQNVFGLERAQDSPAWVITGEGDEVTQSDARQDIIQLLRDKGGKKGMKPSDIARNLHKGISNINRLLAALCELGMVERKTYGHYNLPGEDEPEAET